MALKVVVAGGSGFIGSQIVKRLARDKKNRIWVITRNPLRAKGILPYPNVNFLNLKEGWTVIKGALFEIKPDAVVNAVGILYQDKENTYEKVHVEFTKNLVESVKELAPQRFVHLSSCGVGRNPYSEYFRTKLRAEEIVTLSGLPYTIFRPSVVMGKGQLLFRQLKRFAKFTPLFVVPKTKVQPLHVEDLAEAVYLSLLREELKNRICEVGGKRVYTMGEFIKRALSLVGVNRPVLELPWWAFVPFLPLLKLLGIMDWEHLAMVRTENVCPRNCLPSILPSLRDPFDIELP